MSTGITHYFFFRVVELGGDDPGAETQVLSMCNVYRAAVPDFLDGGQDGTYLSLREEPRTGQGASLFERRAGEIRIALVDDSMLLRVQEWLSACEGCVDDAMIRFDDLIDSLTGYDPTTTEYLMSHPVACPRCGGPIIEKTLVALR
jgi:hypothetical protein